MQYNEIKLSKQYLLITPDELRSALSGMHLVIINTGVPRGYTESDPETFLSAYEKLYGKLKHSEKLSWKDDYCLVGISIGVTLHIDNCRYLPTDKLSVPNFTEPCVSLDTFCFTVIDGQLSKSFSVTRFPENTVGLCLSFPTSIKNNENEIMSDTDLDDYETYNHLISAIKSISTPLKVAINGKTRRTSVLVSEKAKDDLRKFYFFEQNKIEIQ